MVDRDDIEWQDIAAIAAVLTPISMMVMGVIVAAYGFRHGIADFVMVGAGGFAALVLHIITAALDFPKGTAMVLFFGGFAMMFVLVFITDPS